jgi:large subunit ribosomal protein L6
MSRVGNKPIELPKGVSFQQKAGNMGVKGPKGSLERALPGLVQVAEQGGFLQVSRANDTKQARSNHGLCRALLQNMVTGVHAGWSKQLSIQGIGYAAELTGKDLQLRLGYSHPVVYPIPDGVDIEVGPRGALVTINGIDRELVGHVAAVIRGFRKPDAYKGKGVRYAGEHVKLKPGKAGVA